MHLFLTSSPCDNCVPEGADLPCILFEKNDFVSNLRRCFQPGSACVMVAAYPDAYAHNDEMADTFARAFAWHDMPFSRMTMLDGRNAGQAAELIRASGVVILAGGHVPTENAFFTDLGLSGLLRDYPGIVMGISAGTMNACREVYAQPEEAGEATDPSYRRFLPGLGLTEVMVLPHYQMVKDNRVDGLRLFEDITIPDSVGRVFYALPDASYVLQENGHAVLYGEAWIIRDGRMTKLQEDGEAREL